MAPVVRSSAPIVPVRSVAASVDFYKAVLGFRPVFIAEDGATAEVARDGAHVMLIACDDEETLRITATNSAAYLTVDSIDVLWNEVAPALSALPPGRSRAPFDQDYGMREFHVKDPDGFLLLFGETLK